MTRATLHLPPLAGVEIYPLPMSEAFVRNLNFDHPVDSVPDVQEPTFYRVRGALWFLNGQTRTRP